MNDFSPSSGEIPDAAFIHAARKRRQLARELGGDAPLVETEAPNKHLVEEDQDASDDEDEKRIRFSGVKNKTQRQKIAEEIGIVVTKMSFFSQVLAVRPPWYVNMLLFPVQELKAVMMRPWIQVKMRR